MKFKLEIDCDGAAFGSDLYIGPDSDCSLEVTRILEELAIKTHRMGLAAFKLRDINGNSVGFAIIE